MNRLFAVPMVLVALVVSTVGISSTAGHRESPSAIVQRRRRTTSTGMAATYTANNSSTPISPAPR